MDSLQCEGTPYNRLHGGRRDLKKLLSLPAEEGSVTHKAQRGANCQGKKEKDKKGTVLGIAVVIGDSWVES